MPIRPYLDNEVFDPETIETMGEAFTDVLKALRLSDRDDQITQLVASHIVELAQVGIRTKGALVIRAMEDFRVNPQWARRAGTDAELAQRIIATTAIPATASEHSAA